MRTTESQEKMPSLKEKCQAIARNVGIPLGVFDAGGAAAVLNAACSAMGIVPKVGQTLPMISWASPSSSTGQWWACASV